jgi:hypothetical protein
MNAFLPRQVLEHAGKIVTQSFTGKITPKA